jgi:hypothetical protein
MHKKEVYLRVAIWIRAISGAFFILLHSCSHIKPTVPYLNNAAYLLCSARNRELPLTNAQRFGFFSSRLWNDYEESLRDEIAVFGAVPGYILWYIQFGDDFPVKIAEHNKKLDIFTVINQDLKSDQFSLQQNEKILEEIVDGKWDDYFRRFASQVSETQIEVFYRFGYEMNGDWFPWGQKPKLFVNAWRHVYKIFRKEQVTNIKWVFSPGVVWGEKTFESDILPYYPGDEYVDIVALDGYNFGDEHDQYHQWESFHKVYSGSIAGLMSFNKPMWIAEIGCPSEPRRHQWLRDFLDFFDNNSCFEVFFWFNDDKDNEPNFRIDADEASLAVFREWAQRVNRNTEPSDELADLYLKSSEKKSESLSGR